MRMALVMLPLVLLVPSDVLGKSLHVGLGAGLSVPVGDVESTLDEGVAVQGVVRYQPPMLPIGLKVSLNYQKNDLKVVDVGVEDQDQSIVSGLGNATVGMRIGPLRPYVGAGLGAFNITQKTSVDGSETSDSELKFGINGAAGVELRLAGILAFVEARMDNIFTEEGLSESLEDLSSIQFVPVTIGVMF